MYPSEKTTYTEASAEAMVLAKRAGWLIQLRWIAAVCVAASTFACDRILAIEVQAGALYGVAALLGLYNAAILMLLKRGQRVRDGISGRFVKFLVDFQISADLLILAVLLHFSGGIENPFVFFFIFHMIIASILMSVRESYLQATLAVLSFGLVVLLEYAELIQHHCLKGFVERCWFQDRAHILGMYTVFAMTVYLVVYMATYIAVRLRRAEAGHKQANALLRQKDRIKDEYVMRLTHDIKGHLAAIQSCLAVAVTRSLEEQAKGFVERAYDRTIKLTGFSRELLRLTEMKLNGQQKMGHFPLGEAVENAVSEVRGQAEANGIDLVCTVDPTESTIFGDRMPVEELATNLVLNAVKYTPAGGKVSVEVREHVDSMLLQVADTGIGISKDALPKIFDEFYRAENAKQSKKEGTGLGLSIVKHIVDRHRGDIRVESEEGRGTTFSVYFPKSSSGLAAGASEVCAGVI